MRRRNALLLAGALLVGCGGTVAVSEQPGGSDGGALDGPRGSSGSSGGSGGSSGGSSGSSSGADSPSCAQGESMCGGACVDEQTDSNNCGGCGLSCAKACTAGRCLIKLASLPASGQANHIAVGGAGVYWTGLDGTVMSVPLDGGAAVTLASGQDGPMGIAVDGTSVYWVDFGGGARRGSTLKVPLAGGTPTTLASGQTSPQEIALDTASVYWTGADGDVVKVPIGGGTPTTLASGQSFPGGIAVDGTGVYWVNGGALDLDGGMLVAPNTGTVMNAPVGGGAAITLASGQNGPGGIALDATHVYWANVGSQSGGVFVDDGSVMKLPRAGGAATTLATGGILTGIAVDGASVYWANLAGTVMKVPLSGGTPITLASNQNPFHVAVDATSVYWINVAQGWVMKLTPR